MPDNSKGPSSGAGAIPRTLEGLIDFVKNEVDNPPKTGDLFKIPDELPPDWQTFFEKVAAYHERHCAQHRHNLISLEKRSWVMEDKGLSEFDMLYTAVEVKGKANADFRSEKFHEAMMHYVNAIFMFATPDVMNNVAACALKMNIFDVAETFSTNALDMGLLSSPGVTKAYFRRATARLHLGNFDSALQESRLFDAKAADILRPNDSSIENLLLLIHENNQNVKTQEDMANYLKQQPKPSPKSPFTQVLTWAQSNDMQFAKLPDFLKKDMTKFQPPIF